MQLPSDVASHEPSIPLDTSQDRIASDATLRSSALEPPGRVRQNRPRSSGGAAGGSQ